MSASGSKKGPSQGASPAQSRQLANIGQEQRPSSRGSQGSSPAHSRQLANVSMEQRPSSQGSATGQASSPAGLQHRVPSSGKKQQGFPAPLGHDPGRFEAQAGLSHADVIGKRIDLPPEAFFIEEKDQGTGQSKVSSISLQTRPSYCTAGKAGRVQVNQYSLKSIRVPKICQFDVSCIHPVSSSSALTKYHRFGAPTWIPRHERVA